MSSPSTSRRASTRATSSCQRGEPSRTFIALNPLLEEGARLGAQLVEPDDIHRPALA
jgi:hypothetical protein